MDYKELLYKYMRHVQDCEGVNFITSCGGLYYDKNFTEHEKKLLEEIALRVKEDEAV